MSTTDWWNDDEEEEERRSRHNSAGTEEEINETKPRSFSTRTESFRLDGERYDLYGATGSSGVRLKTQHLRPELIPESETNLDDDSPTTAERRRTSFDMTYVTR